ncbi:S8 family serine peptidase [Clostridium gasigenes]|uniref:S8 family serine peptidase n=1 Tax=Clostridium gasigenes TaxID=94869 RepID=UPI001C0D2258|nr:S8 family serine peptidase [Clostridium gasigenes]MBU3107435.1 S8 family serine peptidase [Clostridium gasigenes]
MINVAIIDDGIGIGLYDTYNIIQSIEITPELMVQNVDKCTLFNASHGTICAAIVKLYYPKAILTSIKVLNSKSHKCKSKQLIKAIEWCIDNGIQVANLSLGTIDYRDFKKIKDTINKAYNKGLIIVAACNNKDIFTYPASCTNVIGVKCSKINALKEGEYIFNLYPIDGIELTCCSEHDLFKNGEYLKTTNRCNSYASPMITAEVCKIIDKFPSITLEEIKQKLYKSSINYIEDRIGVNNYKNIDWVNNAALLCRNEREYIFKLPYINQIKNFKRIEDINVNEFDTLILLDSIIKDYENIKSIIYKFEKERKRIIVIDDGCQVENYEVKYQNNNGMFWNSSIVNYFYEECLPQKKMDVPLLIVYDYTDSKMIKVLETLTAKFRNDGYYAVGACTKSIGVLYGLEYIPISKDENLKEIKHKIEVLYKVYDYDIMILGLSINKEDTNIIKKINMYLNPDKSIFLVDSFMNEMNTCIEKMNIDGTLIITSEDDIEKYSYLDYKIFEYKEINLFYKQILNMLLYETEKN